MILFAGVAMWQGWYAWRGWMRPGEGRLSRAVRWAAAGISTALRTSAAKFDGSVTATGGGGDLTLATTSITSGLSIDITGGTITVPAT